MKNKKLLHISSTSLIALPLVFTTISCSSNSEKSIQQIKSKIDLVNKTLTLYTNLNALKDYTCEIIIFETNNITNSGVVASASFKSNDKSIVILNHDDFNKNEVDGKNSFEQIKMGNKYKIMIAIHRDSNIALLKDYQFITTIE